MNQSSSVLKALVLGNNKIGNAGAILLGEALRYNATLKLLYINNNNIDDNGFITFINALRYNKSLLHLEAYNNNLTVTGVIALLAMLQKNVVLQSASVKNDAIRNPSVIVDEKLDEMLLYNDTFYYIDVPENHSITTYQLLQQNRNHARRAPRKYYTVYDWLLQYHIVWGCVPSPTSLLCTTIPNKKKPKLSHGLKY
jgi:hypothetical protein